MSSTGCMRVPRCAVGRGWVGLGLALILALSAGWPPPTHAQELVIVHMPPESDTDTRPQYFIDLLDLILSKTDGAYRLEASPTKMPQGRVLRQLKQGTGIDVAWTMTSVQREQELLPIRIPLLKGLIGTRLLLINEADEARFGQITASEQLKALDAGQGHDWPDTDILRHNGYRVTESPAYDALFRMLHRHRIDYFPRSIEEIWVEAERGADKGLVVEKTIVLQYPTAIYFFVNKTNHALARRLEEGLERALADGSFEALFRKNFYHLIEQADLENRTRFHLENPLLPPKTPVGRRALWYRW